MFVKKQLTIFGFLWFVVLLFACSQEIQQPTTAITSAVWNSQNNILQVEGNVKNHQNAVTIENAIDHSLIGKAAVRSNNSWQLQLFNPVTVPCSVRIEQVTVRVSQAPTTCNTPQRAPVNIQVSDQQAVDAYLPDSRILTPPSDVTIMTGQSVEFNGLSSVSNARFEWNMGGVTKNVSTQNPGKISFPKSGQYRIKLTSSDQAGIPDPTPDERIITVLAPDSQKRILGVAPVASIAAPSKDKTVNVGDSLFFAAAPPPAGEIFQYEWDFGGAALPSSAKVPGVVTFNTAGTFMITLNVIDALGQRSSFADTRTITVNNPVNVNQAPTGIIREPVSDMNIQVGDTVNFMGAVIDPNNNGPYTFIWNFAGAAPNSNLIIPGPVTFTQEGVYPVSFLVLDAAGVPDPAPPIRLIYVSAVGAVNNDFPESTILSPAGDMTIMPGESVIFAGLGDSPSGNVPLTYLWDFGGAAPATDLQVPGPIVFDTPGVYTVAFAAIDSMGQMDPTPATVMITVDAGGGGGGVVSDTAPDGTIVTPAGDMTITVGDSIVFEGEGVSPVGADPLQYLWIFDDGTPETSNMQITDPIVFNEVGETIVKLIVTDANGEEDPTPAMVTVIVEAAPTGAAPVDPIPPDATGPSGMILMPEGDMTIMVGESVDFNGIGSSPSGAEPLIYYWNFGGGAPDFIGQMPGPTVFNEAGKFVVTLLVIDAAGNPDLNPPSVTITVVNPGAPLVQIINPPGDITIAQGDGIDFTGVAISPVGADPVTYVWDFDGPMPAGDLSGPNPGLAIYDMPGIYEVTLTAIDANGIRSMTASIVVTVEPAAGGAVTDPPPGAPAAGISAIPDADILSPATRAVTISAGDSVEFVGLAENVDSAAATMVWDFGGAIPNVTGESPGLVTFEAEGVYTVTFIVINGEGVADPNPPSVDVTVVGAP